MQLETDAAFHDFEDYERLQKAALAIDAFAALPKDEPTSQTTEPKAREFGWEAGI